MSRDFRTIYEPEDVPPPPPPHNCAVINYVGENKPKYKDRSIIECIECGQFWWATVFATGKGEWMDPKQYHLHWAKVRWYHFRLRKFCR